MYVQVEHFLALYINGQGEQKYIKIYFYTWYINVQVDQYYL
jgi:hypothetical protein